MATGPSETVIPGKFALVAMTSGQCLHLFPVVRVKLLLELGDLGIMRPVESRVARVARGGQQLFEAAAQCRSVRQLDVEFNAVVLAAERRQLVTMPLSHALQLGVAQQYADTQNIIT